jgi:hypothetical protein
MPGLPLGKCGTDTYGYAFFSVLVLKYCELECTVLALEWNLPGNVCLA